MTSNYKSDLPYNDLPLLPPIVELETKATLKATIRARSALAELKGAGRLIPNQAMLVRAIVLQEAQQSSEIENIVTTSDELYKAFSLESETGNLQTKEVMRYGEAVWYGVASLSQGRKISGDLFNEVCSLILETDVTFRTHSGTTIKNAITKEIVYTPPVGADRIRLMLDNLTNFLYCDAGLDPLIKLAVSHYQFEAIHPFPDGNGRTGRVINTLYLVEQQLLDLPILYLSKYINHNKSEYYRHLRAVTENYQWESWIEFLLDAIEVTALQTRDKIEQIRKAMDESAHLVRANQPKIYSRELMDVIYSQPYCRVALLEREGIAKRQTAAKYLDSLAEMGILEKSQVWRDNLYLNSRLMEILTA